MTLVRLDGVVREARRFFADFKPWVIGFVGLIAVNIAFRVGVVGPLRSSVRSLDHDIVDGDKKLEKALGEWSKAGRTLALLKAADVNVQDFYHHTLQTRKERYPQVDTAIKDIAKSFHLETTNIAYHSELLPNQGVEKLVVAFPLKGTYQGLRQFLSQIESSKQFFVIEGVALGDSSERGTELNLEISVATYFWSPEADAARLADSKGPS